MRSLPNADSQVICLLAARPKFDIGYLPTAPVDANSKLAISIPTTGIPPEYIPRTVHLSNSDFRKLCTIGVGIGRWLNCKKDSFRSQMSAHQRSVRPAVARFADVGDGHRCRGCAGRCQGCRSEGNNRHDYVLPDAHFICLRYHSQLLQ